MKTKRTSIEIQRKDDMYRVVVVSLASGKIMKVWFETKYEIEAQGFKRAIDK